MEQPPISLGEPLQEFADLEMIGRHGADQGDQFFADAFGDGFLVLFEGEMVAALGGIFVEGTLEEFQGLMDLAFELRAAELENFALLAHKYAYIYAYSRASKSARQEENLETNAKKRP